MAIIDQTLLVDHDEYKDRLRTYEEIHWPAMTPALMHGPAVASIAVGKTVGVAPGADLYFIAEWHAISRAAATSWTSTRWPQSIDRIAGDRCGLPAGRKIRVISISSGWKPAMKGYEAAVKAADRAKARGMFVVSVGLFETYPGHALLPDGPGPRPRPATPTRRHRAGLREGSKRHLTRPELGYRNFCGRRRAGGWLLVPMDSRTTASPTGPQDYVFYRSGGTSWTAPYLAGLYALACQVKPDGDGRGVPRHGPPHG